VLLELLLRLLLTLLELLPLEPLAACRGAKPECEAEAVHILAKATTNKRTAIPSTVFLCIMLYLRFVKCLTMYITVWTKTDSRYFTILFASFMSSKIHVSTIKSTFRNGRIRRCNRCGYIGNQNHIRKGKTCEIHKKQGTVTRALRVHGLRREYFFSAERLNSSRCHFRPKGTGTT